MPKVLKCPSCGSSLEIDERSPSIVRCRYCGVAVQIPIEQPSPQNMPEEAAIFQHIVISVPNMQSSSTGRQPKRASCLGVLAFTILILGVFLAPLGFALESEGGIISTMAAALPTVLSQFEATPVQRLAVTHSVSIQTTMQSTVQVIVDSPTRTAPPTAVNANVQQNRFGSKGTGVGQFQNARSIAVDGRGFVYVADYDTGRVQQFTEAGEYRQTYLLKGRSTQISCLDADSNGVLYVCIGGEIQRIASANGSLLATLRDPRGDWLRSAVVRPDGTVAALTLAAGRDDLLLFNRNGSVAKRVSNVVSSITDQPSTILTITSDGLGNLFILAMREEAIFAFDAEGKYRDRFGAPREEGGEFFGIVNGIAVGADGNLYVGDFDGIKVFSRTGRFIRTLNTVRAPYDFTFTPQGTLFAVDNDEVHWYREIAAPR